MKKNTVTTKINLLPVDLDVNLLTTNIHLRLCDDSTKLWEWFEHISKMVNSRLPKEQFLKCENLQKTFMRLYVRANTKEKDLEKETKTRAKKPFYHITLADSRSRAILNRFRISIL